MPEQEESLAVYSIRQHNLRRSQQKDNEVRMQQFHQDYLEVLQFYKFLRIVAYKTLWQHIVAQAI